MNPVKSVYLRLIACQIALALLGAFAFIVSIKSNSNHIGSFSIATGLVMWIVYSALTYIEMEEFMDAVKHQCHSCQCDDDSQL